MYYIYANVLKMAQTTPPTPLLNQTCFKRNLLISNVLDEGQKIHYLEGLLTMRGDKEEDS